MNCCFSSDWSLFTHLWTHQHCFFFSYLPRLFTQQWSSYLFLTSFKTKFPSPVNRCHIVLLIAFHLTVNNLVRVFRCWLLNPFLLPFCQNKKKYSETSAPTVFPSIYSSVCWKHYCLFVFITLRAVLYTGVLPLNHTKKKKKNLWEKETRIYLCIGGRSISTSHAANLDQQDVILELGDKHLENSILFWCINWLFQSSQRPCYTSPDKA